MEWRTTAWTSCYNVYDVAKDTRFCWGKATGKLQRVMVAENHSSRKDTGIHGRLCTGELAEWPETILESHMMEVDQALAATETKNRCFPPLSMEEIEGQSASCI